MTILNQLNSAPMYLICGGIIAFVAVVCVIFLIRAYRAGKALEFYWESLHFPEAWEHRGHGFVFP